mgnify:CR=1 FL=1
MTIESNQDGANQLAIDLFQPTLVAEGDDESQSVLSSEDVDALGNGLVQTGEVARSGEVDEMSEVIEEVNEIAGSLNQDGESQNTDQFSNVFQGLDADNTADATGQSNVNFSTINPGSGAHDVLVLSSNDNSANTIEIDQSFDKVSVVNFFDNAALTEAGNHSLDFTAYLNNKESESGSTVSEEDIQVTLNQDNTAEANSFTVLTDFVANSDEDETFAGLNDSVLLDALNGDDAYGELDDDTLTPDDQTDDLVGDTQKHIAMVENDQNAGEYKVFELTSTSGNDEEVFDSANLLGTEKSDRHIIDKVTLIS